MLVAGKTMFAYCVRDLSLSRLGEVKGGDGEGPVDCGDVRLVAARRSPCTGGTDRRRVYFPRLRQSVESYLVTPLIQQRTISLPPGLTISAQIGMGLLFGAGGVVLATPLAAAGLVAVKKLYVEDILEKPR